jgi:AraC-like DNA-binding protein
MSEIILSFANITSVFIGYFTSIALVITPFYKSRANNFLSISLFLIASLMFIGFFSTDNIVFSFLENIVLDLLLGATIFSYFLIHIKHTFLKTKHYKWLYAPFLVSVLIEISISFSESFLDLHNSFFDVFIINLKDITSIGFNLFLILFGRKLIKSSKNILEDKRRWLLRFNFFIICIFISFLLAWLEEGIFYTIYFYSVLWTFLGLFFWWFLYYGIFRLQIIVQKEEIHNYLVSQKAPIVISKKKINSSKTAKIISQLYRLMEDDEMYKDPLLSRLDLASRLETSEGALSKIINQEINKSVIQFVNEYRIEAAKKLLQDPVFNKYSVEAIGMESGFKSKSAFYSAFKINLEISPGAYRKLQKSS